MVLNVFKSQLNLNALKFSRLLLNRFVNIGLSDSWFEVVEHFGTRHWWFHRISNCDVMICKTYKICISDLVERCDVKKCEYLQKLLIVATLDMLRFCFPKEFFIRVYKFWLFERKPKFIMRKVVLPKILQNPTRKYNFQAQYSHNTFLFLFLWKLRTFHETRNDGKTKNNKHWYCLNKRINILMICVLADVLCANAMLLRFATKLTFVTKLKVPNQF